MNFTQNITWDELKTLQAKEEVVMRAIEVVNTYKESLINTYKLDEDRNVEIINSGFMDMTSVISEQGAAQPVIVLRTLDHPNPVFAPRLKENLEEFIKDVQAWEADMNGAAREKLLQKVYVKYPKSHLKENAI